MSHKLFVERLNKELDAIGLPSRSDERIDAFSKLLKIPKFKAAAFLDGVSLPDAELLSCLAEEFEVNGDWLIGKSDQRQKKNRA